MNKFFQQASLSQPGMRQKIAKIVVGHVAALLVLEGLLLFVLWGL